MTCLDRVSLVIRSVSRRLTLWPTNRLPANPMNGDVSVIARALAKGKRTQNDQRSDSMNPNNLLSAEHFERVGRLADLADRLEERFTIFDRLEQRFDRLERLFRRMGSR